jgi:hypothetical protein
MVHNILPHIIHREVLELHLPRNRFDGHIEGGVKNALEASRNLLEKVLDLYDQHDRVTIIDEIFLDLGRFNTDQLDLFGSRLCEALADALKQNIVHREKQGFAEIPTMLSNAETAGLSQTLIHSSFNEVTNHKIGKIEESAIEKALPKAFLYFLENGAFPWWLSDQMGSDVESIFATVSDNITTAQLRELKSLLKNNSNARQRLTHQFSTHFINKLIASLKQATRRDVVLIIEAIERHLFHAKAYHRNEEIIESNRASLSIRILVSDDVDSAVNVFISFLEQHIVDGHDNADSIEKLLSEKCFTVFDKKIRESISAVVIAHQVIQTVESSHIDADKKIPLKANDDKKRDSDAEVADKFIYVHHAGLVILHPFLSQFFSTLGLLSESKHFVDEFAQAKALYLLGFLSTGKMDLSEPELSICKFICGMPLKKAIVKTIRLNEYETKECNELLGAVVGYWPALKNTSPDGLRDAFLTRKGKLDMSEDTTVLYVESKPVDVLLESLPWGLSYIHLPWLTNPFSTIWN